MKYQRLAMCDKRLRRYIPSESDHQIHSEFTFIELCPKTQRYIYIYIYPHVIFSFLSIYEHDHRSSRVRYKEKKRSQQ